MQYVTIRRFKREGIGGEFNIPYGKTLELRDDGLLYYADKPVCVARSFASHEHFASDYDGNGKIRGMLTHAIIKELDVVKEEREEKWKPIENDILAQKYRRPEHLDYWLWNDDFFNAPIEDLEYIAALADIKKGL